MVLDRITRIEPQPLWTCDGKLRRGMAYPDNDVRSDEHSPIPDRLGEGEYVSLPLTELPGIQEFVEVI